jgi:ferredoxin
MPHVITSLCLREGSCASACPVECIVPGNPVDKYPQYYIDADTCIDCGACVAVCPCEAIFPRDEVPEVYSANNGQRQSKPVGTPGFTEKYEDMDSNHNLVVLKATRILKGGEVINLTDAIEANVDFFKNGPGYRSAGK